MAPLCTAHLSNPSSRMSEEKPCTAFHCSQGKQGAFAGVGVSHERQRLQAAVGAGKHLGCAAPILHDTSLPDQRPRCLPTRLQVLGEAERAAAKCIGLGPGPESIRAGR